MGIIVPRGEKNLESAFGRIPRINLEYDDAKRTEIGRAMVRALIDHGVIVLVTNAEDTRMASDVHSSVANFFAMTVEEKVRASDVANESGYRKWGHSRSCFGFPELDDSVLRKANMQIHGQEYDERIMALDRDLARFQKFSEGVVRLLLNGLMEYYDSDSDVDFAPYSAVQANSYARPTQEQIDEAARDMLDPVAKQRLREMTVESAIEQEESQGLHDDEEIATVMLPASHPALLFEVKGSDGGLYVLARLKKDEVAIIPSRVLWRLSGGEIEGLRHKVRNRLKENIDRRSIQYFVNSPPHVEAFKENETNRGIDIGQEAADRAVALFNSHPSLFVNPDVR